LYLIPNLHNPTATVLPAARREAVAAVAERHNIAVIEDDVFGCLLAERPPPIASLIPELAFYVTSFSKGVAPGLRIGYAVVPTARYQHMLSALRVTTWMASPLTAEVASGWVLDGTTARLIELQASCIGERQAAAREALADLSYQPHSRSPHIWLRLPEPWRESEATIALSRRGVEVTPGEYFAVGRGNIPHALRLCLGPIADLALLHHAGRIIADTLTRPPGDFGPEV
jgi:DNA-binding transcriptional MocR family regulator